MKTWRFRLTKDGRLIDISLTVSPIKNESGEIIGASKIARDISESKRAQERLKLLLREMDHRVKNLFSLAISVLSLSGRSAKTAHGVVETRSARLTALARALSHLAFLLLITYLKVGLGFNRFNGLGSR